MKLVIKVGPLWARSPTPFVSSETRLLKQGPIISPNSRAIFVYKNYYSDLHMEIISHICILIMIFSARVMNNKIAKYAYCHL